MRARAFSKQKFRLCTAFCSANMLLILPAPVFADSGVIHLTCRPSGSAANVMIQDDPTIVDLDKAQATATVHFASFRLQGSIGGPVSARTVGPMHATFSDETVTFENPDPNSAPNGGHDEYVLNRLTGAFRGLWGEDEFSCQVATNQF